MNRMFSILAVLMLVLMGTPTGAAGDVTELVASWVDTNGGSGDFLMVCAAPFFINCSFAAAFSAGGCFDMKVRTMCLSAGGGAIGGISSLAIANFGGGANGVISGVTKKCNWGGTSGGCASTGGSINLECKAYAAEGVGHLNAGPLPPSLARAGLEAPPAHAQSVPCSELLAPIFEELTQSLATAESPQDAEVRIEQHFVAAIDKEVAELMHRATASLAPDAAAVVVDGLANARASTVEEIRQITVDEDWQISLS